MTPLLTAQKMLIVQEIVNGVAVNGLFQYYAQSAEKTRERL